ncbi:TPA: hypothetical protein ACGO9Z_000570 [Streptococcus suis]
MNKVENLLIGLALGIVVFSLVDFLLEIGLLLLIIVVFMKFWNKKECA